MINEAKMEQIMLELGHTENLSGTGYLRQAICLYEERAGQMCGEIYPAIAQAVNASPTQVERNMRHSIEKAWNRGNIAAQQQYFGYSVSPDRGRPTVGEYVARMARLCHEN